MADNERSRELFFEAMLKQAVILKVEREMAELPSEKELSKTLSFSPRHIERMKKLFAATARRDAMKRVLASARRVATFVFVAAGILFGLLMLNPRVRSAVADTAVEWFDTFTRFGSRERQDPGEFDKGLRPEYLPDGFAEIAAVESDGMVTVIYSGGGVHMTFCYCPIEMHMSVNNEDVAYEERSVGGRSFYIFAAQSEDKYNIVLWEAEGARFTLSSTIGMDDLLRVALSVAASK